MKIIHPTSLRVRLLVPALVVFPVFLPSFSLASAGGPGRVDSIQSSPAAADSRHEWSYSAAGYFYFIPDEKDYLVATATADRDWLHLEFRYNNEAAYTGSVWVGYNFETGEEVHLVFTPVAGVTFGDVTGVDPGYLMTLGGSHFELYSEGALVFDFHDSSENYFYTWSELSYSPFEWGRVGIVAQRTRTYETGLDVQRGLLAGVSHNRLTLTGYVFNPDQSKPFYVLNLAVEF